MSNSDALVRAVDALRQSIDDLILTHSYRSRAAVDRAIKRRQADLFRQEESKIIPRRRSRKDWSKVKRKALALVARGMTYAAIAQDLDVAAKTVSRWSKEANRRADADNG